MTAPPGAAKKLSAGIRPPLREGAERRHAPVADDDPDRIRLVEVVSLRDVNRVGWLRACRQYVKDNLGLAIKFAREVDARHVPLEDRINDAGVGLLKAIMNFDLGRAGRFSTYAVWKMRHEVGQLIRRDEALVAVPGQLVDDKRALEAMRQSLCSLLGCEPDDEQLLIALREAEARDLARRSIEALDTGSDIPGPRWQDATLATVRNVREAYAGFSHKQVDPRWIAPDAGMSAELRADVRRAMGLLRPDELAVFAREHDLWPVDDAALPSCIVVRRARLLQAERKLRRALGGG